MVDGGLIALEPIPPGASEDSRLPWGGFGVVGGGHSGEVSAKMKFGFRGRFVGRLQTAQSGAQRQSGRCELK